MPRLVKGPASSDIDDFLKQTLFTGKLGVESLKGAQPCSIAFYTSPLLV